MSSYPCHTEPNTFEFTTAVLAARGNAVCLEQSFFYPGGGGQLPDRGVLRWADKVAPVSHIETEGPRIWHYLDCEELPTGEVMASIDRPFRAMMSQLHTTLHILNAIVYQRFEGALVTGVQMADDATARIDFDLPEADNSTLKALEPDVNAVIEAGLPVREFYLPANELSREQGLIRSRSVGPPQQGNHLVRIIEIEGLDSQACGGTHVTLTSQAAPIRILKVENKGKRNRRIRIGLVDS